MFVDYVSLLLINTMIGYFLLAWYVYAGAGRPDQRQWAPAFAMVGLVAFLGGSAHGLHVAPHRAVQRCLW